MFVSLLSEGTVTCVPALRIAAVLLCGVVGCERAREMAYQYPLRCWRAALNFVHLNFEQSLACSVQAVQALRWAGCVSALTCVTSADFVQLAVLRPRVRFCVSVRDGHRVCA